LLLGNPVTRQPRVWPISSFTSNRSFFTKQCLLRIFLIKITCVDPQADQPWLEPWAESTLVRLFVLISKRKYIWCYSKRMEQWSFIMWNTTWYFKVPWIYKPHFAQYFPNFFDINIVHFRPTIFIQKMRNPPSPLPLIVFEVQKLSSSLNVMQRAKQAKFISFCRQRVFL